MGRKILIVDDHPVVQMGMHAFIERNRLFDSTDLAGTGKEALRYLKKSKAEPYCMAIVDLNLPDYEATALVRRIKDLAPDLAIMIFSMEPSKLYVRSLMELGVKGFLNKTANDEELLFALKNILAGRSYFSSDIVSEMIDAFEDQKKGDANEALSERESEILNLMIRGKSPSLICQILNLHKSSVATYRARILDKLGLSSNFELYQWASKEGLIRP